MNLRPKLDPDPWFVSSRPADRRALVQGALVLGASTLVFLSALPFVRQPGPVAPAFLPFYVASLMFCDFTTVVLLLGHFAVRRLWSILVLAAGYLFTGLMTLGYTLVFPGLFFPPEVWGTGAQTSSAMYMFWHGGFPLFVVAYTLLSRREASGSEDRRGRPNKKGWEPRVWAVFGLVVAVAAGWTVLATRGSGLLPQFLQGNTTTALGHLVLFGVWFLSLGALVLHGALKWRSPTVLDVWLGVVLVVWLFDLALAALINTGRYDLGWYTGRLYGLLAAAFLLGLLLSEISSSYGRLVQVSLSLNQANHRLERLALSDGLTGIGNRRRFDASLAALWQASRDEGTPLALLLCDADHFKAYNDTYGHQAGDDCLRAIAAALTRSCRRDLDEAARYGGEEFALLLPRTDAQGALAMAEAVRAEVYACRIAATDAGPEAFVTVSVGVAFSASQPDSPEELVERADRALYLAKTTGRNRVQIYPTGP